MAASTLKRRAARSGWRQCATATVSITVDGDVALCEVRGLVTGCALAEIMRHIEGVVEARHLHCFVLCCDRAALVPKGCPCADRSRQRAHRYLRRRQQQRGRRDHALHLERGRSLRSRFV